MAKEHFFYPESAELLKTLDQAAERSGVSRGHPPSMFAVLTVPEFVQAAPRPFGRGALSG